ncbi:MAG: aspartyl protease family protein [Sphingomonadales bacterium]|nr:aspartyl protease family protein [Sphingomonadales bacterium]
MRALFIWIFAFGFLGALLGHLPSRSSSAKIPDAAQRAFDGERDRIAELKAQNSPQFTREDGAVELQRSSDGHFYADVRINNVSVHMLVDTGASVIALSRDDARSAGLATSIGMNDVVGEGADGAVHGEFARLDKVELGPLSAEGLEAVVLNGGQQSLLGQSFLSKFASVQIEGDRMILR